MRFRYNFLRFLRPKYRQHYSGTKGVIDDYRLSQWFRANVDPVLGWAHHVEVGCVAKIMQAFLNSLQFHKKYND
jgi:hypothetical protein